MKKLLLSAFLVLLFAPSVLCNDTIPGKVIFYREPNFQGSAVSYKVFVNNTLVVNLRNNSYFIYNCLPGEYDFRLNKDQAAKIHLKIEQGKVYFLRFGMRTGFWSGIPELLLVDSVSALPALRSGTMRLIDEKNSQLIRPENRFGLNINSGPGFESVPMVTTTTGDESKISFGGGFAIGLKYGYEFGKHFDLAFDLNYQRSELNPYLKNGEISFERGYASITPAYIVPIDGGDAMRLKFGAGLDYFFGSILTIETGEISGGFNDKWKYNNPLGFHLNVIFEMNFSDKWSANYGLKWYNTAYKFTSGEYHYPTIDKLTNPDGSGIDLMFGFYYHF